LPSSCPRRRGCASTCAAKAGRRPTPATARWGAVGAGDAGCAVLQVASGLVSDDGAGFTGPLNEFVSSAGGVFATMLHKQYGQWVLLGLVLLHVVAIAFYRIVRRRSLVKAMMDGDKLLPKAMPPSRDDSVTRSMAAVLFVLCLTLVQSTVGA
jgi:hypothetical protein